MEELEKWLDTFRSDNTKRVYRAGIKTFLSSISQEDVNRYVAEVKNGRDYFQDLVKFASFMQKQNYPPKTANCYIQATKSFLEYTFNIELTKKQWRELINYLPKGKRARTIEDNLTKDKLKRILTHCDAKGKALFLLLESSGIRISEALQLQLSDIKWDTDPVEITVRGEYTKTGDPYYSFITREAKDALLEWLKVRESYLTSAEKRGVGLSKLGDGRGVKSTEDERVFPFSSFVAMQIWNNALRKTQLENHDKTTNRRTLHIHMLRKFFLSKLKLVIPKEIAEALAGHEEGLDEAYRRYTKEEVRDWYIKAEPYLYIFVPSDIVEIQTTFSNQLLKLKEQVHDLLYQNQKLMVQRDDLQQTLRDLQAKLIGLEARMKRFEDFTTRFMRATPDELEELGRLIFEKKRKEIEKFIAEES
ncbi:MAG: tyrosine-type recombinase/integrase [Fervidobacterium sp.]